MLRVGKRRLEIGPALIVAIAAGIIGCGGGGGGGAQKEPAVMTSGGIDSSTGGSAGEVTSGGTTGIPATTGTTGADPTTGTTASDPTTGSTGNDPTTGSTGSDSTSGGTTGSDPGPSGQLRPNAIYFGHWDDASLVSSVLPDGTGRQEEGGMGANVGAAIPDPDVAGRFVYAAQSAGAYGIYRGATFDPVASDRLAAPAYDRIATLQAASGGDVMMVAILHGTSRLFLISNGTVQDIDDADGAAISLDGTKIAYTKIVNGLDEVFLWDRATGASRLLAAGGDSLFPSFSKSGAWVLFSSNRDDSGGATWDLYQVPSAGGTVERVTNTPTISEFGACYNDSRTMVSYVGISPDPDEAGVYVASNGGATRIAADSDVNLATYWTSPQGRSFRARNARYQRIDRRR